MILKEKIVSIPSVGAQLEGRLHEAGQRPPSIVLHPHPLYGGNQDNNVVRAAAATLARLGHPVLCFNFRGVGQSTGSFDHGRGEGRDLMAASQFMRRAEHEKVLVVGYSFGAWVAINDWNKKLFIPFILIAPPVSFMEFAPAPPGAAGLVICGERDEFGPPELVRAWLPEGPEPLVISGADHFFAGRETEISQAMETYLSSIT